MLSSPLVRKIYTRMLKRQGFVKEVGNIDEEEHEDETVIY